MFDALFGFSKAIVRRGLQRLPRRVRDFMVHSLAPSKANASQQAQEVHAMRREVEAALSERAELARRHHELEQAATLLQPFIDGATGPLLFSSATARGGSGARFAHLRSASPHCRGGQPSRSRATRSPGTLRRILLRSAFYCDPARRPPLLLRERILFILRRTVSALYAPARPSEARDRGWLGLLVRRDPRYCELFLGNEVDCTFIEPYTDLLRSVLKPGDTERINTIEKPLQDVPVSLFEGLTANDILFIDSTHVSRVGSDVNFEVLPVLRSGVFIHFHDVFWPFEYPESWI